MLVATDVAYFDAASDAEATARAAAVAFRDWADAVPASAWVEPVDQVAAYEPGRFYLRELPCIWPLLLRAQSQAPIDVVIVDGYVDLGVDRAGLGRHVYDRLQAEGVNAAVVGVAKNFFRGSDATPVLRGTSQTPLWVTAAGMRVEDAAQAVTHMHGPHRFPTLLRWVDQLANGVEPAG